jgi:hypothetical protein
MISEHLGGIKKNPNGELELYKTEPNEDVSQKKQANKSSVFFPHV